MARVPKSLWGGVTKYPSEKLTGKMKPLAGVGIIHREVKERSEKSNASEREKNLPKDPGGGRGSSEEVKSVQYR